MNVAESKSKNHIVYPPGITNTPKTRVFCIKKVHFSGTLILKGTFHRGSYSPYSFHPGIQKGSRDFIYEDHYFDDPDLALRNPISSIF